MQQPRTACQTMEPDDDDTGRRYVARQRITLNIAAVASGTEAVVDVVKPGDPTLQAASRYNRDGIDGCGVRNRRYRAQHPGRPASGRSRRLLHRWNCCKWRDHSARQRMRTAASGVRPQFGSSDGCRKIDNTQATTPIRRRINESEGIEQQEERD